MQFLLLLWKNFILQVRRPLGTAVELIIPPFSVIVLIGLKFGVFDVQSRCFVTFPSDPLTVPLPNNTYQIYYTPINVNTSSIAECIRQRLPSAEVTGVNSEDEMVLALSSVPPPISFNGEHLRGLGVPTNRPLGCFIRGAGIVFNNLEGGNLEYTLRLRHEVGEDLSWETRDAAPSFQAPGPRITDNFYFSEGFVHLESIVGEAIIRLMANPDMTECEGVLEHNISVSMRQLPYPQYTVDFFLITAVSILPFLIVLVFMYSAGTFTKELVLEKETRIRESMLMMGLQQWVLWTTWFIKQFVFLSISTFFVAILLKVGGVFPRSDFFLLLLFLLLFNISAISFCFFLSVWFNSARIGLLIGFIGWFVNYLPYIFVPRRYQTLSLGSKVAFCILSNTCMGLGINTIALLEIREEGVQWNNFYEDISLDDDFHLGYVFLMLIIDSIVYMLVAWYVNGVKPGQFGVPKPFYFPFQPSYWLGRPAVTKASDNSAGVGVSPPVDLDPSAHEVEPSGVPIGISIQYLTKIYDETPLRRLLRNKEKQRNKKIAVDELNLNMYEGQITALLGHNGAGKTTTISVLTGLYTPTAGTAVINGYDIRSNMDQIRHSLGICPQHNVLFDRLTVLEHLKFFARIKGVKGKRVQDEADHMIKDLQLRDKRNTPSKKLSGGMKRKLSAGIALIGGSKFVILDEPTSGIDPYARRAIWDLLIRYKRGRTILLTTHSMDEADLLGDRIAIMAEGKLCCSGSSLFLKSRYGVGYRMVIVKEPSCDSAKVTNTVTSVVQEGKKVTDVGAELSYVLPSSSSQHFPRLFDTLEAHKTELGIAGFGISVTTMEEVFIKVGEGTDETLEQCIQHSVDATSDVAACSSLSPSLTHSIRLSSSAKQGLDAQMAEDNGEEEEPEVVGNTSLIIEDPSKPPKDFVPNSGIILWFQQFRALFLKRFYNSLRFWQAIITQLILPLLFVLIAMILAVTLPNANKNDPLRSLTISNSALDPSNRLVFFAEFGADPSSAIDFGFLRAESIGATELLNYTSDALDMYSHVQNSFDNQSQCCNYSYQLLDKFCARQPMNYFKCDDTSFKSKFGYRHCTNCLNCCEASRAVVPSCTNPLTQTMTTDQSELCPTPPQLSREDTINNATGALHSENVFVDEALLRKGNDMDPAVYIRRMQAGFVLSYRDPPYAVCGCNDIEYFTQEYFSELSECTNTNGSQLYALKLDSMFAQYLDWLSRDCDEYTSGNFSGESYIGIGGSGRRSGSNFCGPGGCVQTFNEGYTVDGVSANLLQLLACGNDTLHSGCNGESGQDRPAAEYYLEQTPQISATVFYNNNPWHMSAAALNAFHNVWLRQATGDNNLRLTINNHPLPRTVDAQVEATQQNFNGFAIGTMVVFGFSFLISTFVLFPIKEKEIKAKHLQFVSGVDVTSFWTSTFAWDLLNAMVPVILSVILFAAFRVDGYTGDGLFGVFLLLLLSCWCTIPMVYSVSFLFSNSLVAFAVIFFFLFLSSQVFLLVQFFVTDQGIKDGLHFITLFDPSYALSIGLNDLYVNNIVRDTCTQNNFTRTSCERSDTIRFVDNPLSLDRPGIGANLIYMVLEGILFMVLTLLLENYMFLPELRKMLRKWCGDKQTSEKATEELYGEDEDVAAERKKVMSGATTENETVIIKNLVKEYHKSLDGCTLREAKLAVNGISLSITSGECFGLLGVNGAGKTTVFSILTGDISPSSGTALIAGYDITTDLRRVQQRIGYCPQFDALIERMTGRELLTMFARLRGIPEHLISQAVEAEVVRLDLKKHASKQCGKYSGGNKRKLSTAIALVGNPPIVFLDEPTTGMDPATRRYLWDVLTGVTREGRSIVLTSHSMEECEALCTRLAIMVNGQFKCLGSIQHLKNKFGSGFSLQAKLAVAGISPHTSQMSHKETAFSATTPEPADSNTEVKNVSSKRDTNVAQDHSVSNITLCNKTPLHLFIKEAFAGAELIEDHQGSVTYQLPSAGMTWSSVFHLLETNKERFGIIDYSVSQTTLEQVFINFAQKQDETIL